MIILWSYDILKKSRTNIPIFPWCHNPSSLLRLHDVSIPAETLFKKIFVTLARYNLLLLSNLFEFFQHKDLYYSCITLWLRKTQQNRNCVVPIKLPMLVSSYRVLIKINLKWLSDNWILIKLKFVMDTLLQLVTISTYI